MRACELALYLLTGPTFGRVALLEDTGMQSNAAKRWAGQKVQRKFTGTHAWSPDWRAKKRTVLCWKLVVKQFTGKVNPKFLHRLLRKCNEPTALSLSKAEAELRWEEAKYIRSGLYQC